MGQRGEEVMPRPEAEPLAFADLTEEQREAGAKASELLRRMARSPRDLTGTRAKVHSYLPVIDGSRHNQIVLIDGARGSGKSALLLSLLDAYGKALVEQQVPPGYEAWIRPADRVVPVGLIDLQPLPSSTHLLLHLVASLEHVVQAMEEHQDVPRLGSAAWHPGGGDELASRRRWREFARIAASGWEGNLAERKGRLDPEAFAVEVEQGELQRLSLTSVFRAFVDALVEDYQAWNRWQSPPAPLFLLAIDDADLNPHLSVELLELMRKLWHPQLAFLITGDTELFLTMLSQQGPRETSAHSGPRAALFISGDGSTDRQRQWQLGMDLYSKSIPQLHRCRLSGVPPSKRLEVGPGLEGLLQRFAVSAEHPTFAHSLVDYFVHDPQIQEALPTRLRHLWEFSAWLQPPEPGVLNKGLSSDAAVMRLWQWTVRGASLTDTLRDRMNSLVWLDAKTGDLKLDHDFIIDVQVEPVMAVEHAGVARLTLARPYRVKAFFDKNGTQALDAPMTAALMLITDFLVETLAPPHPPLAPNGLLTPLFAHAVLVQEIAKAPLNYVWPVPEWESFLALALLRKEWTDVLDFPASHPDAPERAAKHFLRSVLRVGSMLAEGARESSAEPSSWKELASDLARAAARRSSGSSAQRTLGRWALNQAGLLAAPESGLPAEVANTFLLALLESFDEEARELRQALSDARKFRLFQSQQREKERGRNSWGEQSSLEKLITAIDLQAPEHQFGELIEAASQDISDTKAERFNQLMAFLEQVKLRWLGELLGTSRRDLSLRRYLSSSRERWLSEAPTAFLVKAQQALAPFTRMQDAGAPALTAMWKSASASVEGAIQAEDVQQIPQGLRIAEPLRRRLDEARMPCPQAEVVLSFEPSTQLASKVHRVEGSLSPLLVGGRTPPAVRAMETILRMAYDHAQDLSESNSSPGGLWRGCETSLDSRALSLWPVPAWPTLYEWECIEACWNDAMDFAQTAAGDVTVLSDTRILDGLAFCLMSACQMLESREALDATLKLGLQKSDWKDFIRKTSKTLLRGNKTRVSAYRTWRKQMPLMAAPESGLSVRACSGILAGLSMQTSHEKEANRLRLLKRLGAKDPEAEKVFNDRMNNAFSRSELAEPEEEGSDIPQVKRAERASLSPHFNTLRRARLVDAGVRSDEVDALLSAVDARYPEHPWVKLFGPWPGAVETPSP